MEGLAQRALVEVAQRNVHHLREPLEQRRDELAKRHQVVFVVAVGVLCVGGASPVPSWCSPAASPNGMPSRAAFRWHQGAQSGFAGPPGSRALSCWGSSGNGSFWGYHQVGLCRAQLGVPGQRQRYAGARLKFSSCAMLPCSRATRTPGPSGQGCKRWCCTRPQGEQHQRQPHWPSGSPPQALRQHPGSGAIAAPAVRPSHGARGARGAIDMGVATGPTESPSTARPVPVRPADQHAMKKDAGALLIAP